MIECWPSLKAHQLQSNNSSEFVNKAIEQFYQLNGIIHETTIPYLLKQNGITEQAIAVFFEMVYCML